VVEHIIGALSIFGEPHVKPGRNDPCACGSGKKYKKCCAQRDFGACAVRSLDDPADASKATLHTPRPESPGPSPAEISQLVALVNAGRYLELEGRARELLLQYPNSGLVWKVLGLTLWLQGKDALEPLHTATELLPDDAEAHSNLGNAFRAAGQLEHAVKSHRRALTVKPNYAEAHNNLGSALLDLGHLDEAMASFRRALAIKPDFALAHSNLGNVLTLQNRRMEAEVACRRALEINPRLAVAIVQLAELQSDKGQFAEAEDLLKRAIAIEPDMPEAWSGLVRWRKMARGDPAWLAEAQRILGQRLSPRREVHLRYALGKYFDDVRDFEQAFNNYRRANELTKLYSAKYDRHASTRSVDQIIHTYNQEWLRRTAIDANKSERPVLVVGMWRSGTTLAEQILASHAAVFGAGEVTFWTPASAVYEQSVANGEMGNSVLRKLAGDYLSLLHGLSVDALRVVDKMCANVLHLGLIHAAFPNARIIHMRRNPIDTCLSIYFQHFQNTHFFANDLTDLAHYYAEYVRVIEHWRLILPKHAILDVPYEKLVDDQEAWSRAMLDFIDLPWDPRCKDFDRTDRAVATFSKWQVRQGISKASVERWRNYESFVAPLRGLAEPQPSE
jgi:tetratricopeptide (TPR) repeat protein